MTDFLDPTVKTRLAREVMKQTQSLYFGVMPWLTLHTDYLKELRRVHELSVHQLADVLLDIAYIWRDGATLTRHGLSALIDEFVGKTCAEAAD